MVLGTTKDDLKPEMMKEYGTKINMRKANLKINYRALMKLKTKEGK